MVLQMGGKTSAASKNKWNEKTYDRINLVVRKGQKEQIQEYAKEKGMSLNAYINALIQADMGEHLTPGVVKNLEGDADSVEWDSCSISPDLIKIWQQKASAFHRNVIGRGFFSVKNSLTHAKEHKSGWQWIWNSKIHLKREYALQGKPSKSFGELLNLLLQFIE